jgi:hypothetical protein
MHRDARATDWDTYYRSVPATAQLTRKYTTAQLLGNIRMHARSSQIGGLSVVEIGGANSCFLDAITRGVPCRSYDVIDTNEYGLSLLKSRSVATQLGLHQQSVLDVKLQAQADVVFSVGLVEHFDPADTRRAVLAHFDLAREGGLVIITFPTPTWLYRASRGAIETAGMWKFPDERPLLPQEVLATMQECGEVLERKTMWPLVLTQYLVAARKK